MAWRHGVQFRGRHKWRHGARRRAPDTQQCSEQPCPARALHQALWAGTPQDSTVYSVPPHQLVGGGGAPRRTKNTAPVHVRHGADRQWNPSPGGVAVVRTFSRPG